MGHDASDDFERHEPDDEQERDRQCSPVCVGADVMYVATTVVMMVAARVIVLVLLTGHTFPFG
jgi:hypothetical protein